MKVDLHQISELAYASISRTVLYLGIGLNAALDGQFKKWQLGEIDVIRQMPITFHLHPGDMNDEQLPFVKEQFARWLIGNGLRELIESFELFLDHIHIACLNIRTAKGFPLNSASNDLQAKFHRMGIEEKLKQLMKRFNVGPVFPAYLNTIKSARNCLTHRLGVVRSRDINENDSFVIRWNTYILYLITPEGESIIDKMPVFVPPFGSIEARRITREIHFRLEEMVTFTPSQLLEICMFFASCADEVVISTSNYARSIGANIIIDDTRIGSAFDVGSP